VLLRRLDPKPTSCLLIHRAGSRIDRIEVESLLAVGVSQGHAVVMTIGAPLVRFGQFLHSLLNGVEAIYNETIVQRAPPDVFSTLYPDVDKHKRFGKKSPVHHPFGECGIVVECKIDIHTSGLSWYTSCRRRRGRRAEAIHAPRPPETRNRRPSHPDGPAITLSHSRSKLGWLFGTALAEQSENLER
jgi:hypothetical protein